MSGLIDVIEQLLENDLNEKTQDKTDKAIAKNNGMNVAKPSGGAKPNADEAGIGRNMDSGPGGPNDALGSKDVGDMNKGKIKSGAGDNSKEVGPGMSMDSGKGATNNSGMDDKGPNKKDKSGPATKTTKAFPSDASPENLADQKPVNQASKTMKEEDELEEGKMKGKKEAVEDPDAGGPMGDKDAKKMATKKGDDEDSVTDDGEGMDPVGDGDADVDNDGDTDASDEVIMKKRDAIDKADGDDDPDIGEGVEEGKKMKMKEKDMDMDDEKMDMEEKKSCSEEDEEMMDEKKKCSEDDMMDDEEMVDMEEDVMSIPEQKVIDEMSDEDIDGLDEEKLMELFGKKKMGIHPNRDSWNKRRDALNKQYGQGKYRKEEDENMEEAHKLPHGLKTPAQKTDSVPSEKMPGKESGTANDKHRPADEKGDNMPKTKMEVDPTGDKSHDQGGDNMETAIKGASVKNTKGSMTGDAGTDEASPCAVDTVDQKNQAKEPTGGAKVRKLGEEADEVELDEDFKTKAAIVFETAVNEKTEMIREELEASYEAKLAEELEAVNEKVSEYVDYAVQEWIQENQLEIKYSLRTEIAENFIKGLKGLFNESYVEIPEEEFSVVDDLTEAVESYKEQLEEQAEALEEAQQELLAIRRDQIVEDVADDLTETQKIRLEKLSESVEATDIEEFRFKVEALKESYFDPSAEDSVLLSSLSEEVVGTVEHLSEEDDTSVSMYANFLSRTTLK